MALTDNPHEFVRFAAGADYRLVCAECIYPRRHPIHGLTAGLEREPERAHHKDNPPVPVESVRSAYANIIDALDEYNEMLPDGDQVCIPFALQTVLADYIAEQEAIASLTGGDT